MHPLYPSRLFLFVMLALASTRASGQVPEAPISLVSELQIEGAEAASTREIEARILTTERSWKPWARSRPFDPVELDADMDRIRTLYRSLGYYEATARHALTWNDEHDEVAITITVDEGAPVRVEDWTIELAEPVPDLDPGQIREGLPLAPGEVFGVARYQGIREELLRRVGNRGYPAARLEGGAEVRLAIRAASVHWVVHPGPRVRLREIRVEGLESVAEPLVRHELELLEGTLYRTDEVEAARTRVSALGLFESVSIELEREPLPDGATSASWPLVVRVKEARLRRISAGVGFGTEDGPRLRLGWRHLNWLGGLRSLEAAAKYSFLVAEVGMQLRQPRFLHPDQELLLWTRVSRETLPAYDADSVGAGFELTRRFDKGWSVFGGWQLDYSHITDQSDDLDDSFFEDETRVRLAWLTGGVRRVRLDDEIDPTTGSWLELRLEPAHSAIGSEIDFLRVRGEGRLFRPLGRTVLALRLMGGTLEPVGSTGDRDIPAVARFFSGGSNSVRGFEYQHLGPLDESDDPIGGLTLLEANAELRFPIWKNLGGVAFVDAGHVAVRPTHFDSDQLFYSSGAGFRYKTPLGPLRLDLGYILNPDPGVSRFRVHFSVGQAF